MDNPRDIEIDLDKFEKDLTADLTAFRAETDAIMDTLTKSMIDVVQLSKTKQDMYIQRKKFTSKKFSLMNKSATLVKFRKQINKLLIKSNKTGKNLLPSFEDGQLILKNDIEREAIYGGYFRQLDYLISLIDNYLNYIKDNIDTIDKMLFGFQYTIELEKYKDK